ncbi:arsenate reductase [Pelagibius sp.]|uniref:arsenate reductase n=1 Tax=Pelagibius sp. TaxID=1931238 RepID=UPI0026051DC6|nr:arsenate reductase [Pelagibius sp.]
MITIYGLKNCDSCRKAKAWLESDHDAVRLHDLRDDGVPAAELEDWLARLGWERLLNRRSTTWRGLPPEEKEGLDGPAAERLMRAHPTLIKRPVIRVGEHLVVGFSATEQAALREVLAGP